jgi:hypothetical protein
MKIKVFQDAWDQSYKTSLKMHEIKIESLNPLDKKMHVLKVETLIKLNKKM